MWVQYQPGHSEPNQKSYFYHTVSGDTLWSPPPGVVIEYACSREPQTGQAYYWNLTTRERRWVAPEPERTTASRMSQSASSTGRPYIQPDGDWVFMPIREGEAALSPLRSSMYPEQPPTKPNVWSGSTDFVWVAVYTPDNSGNVGYFWKMPLPNVNGLGGVVCYDLPDGHTADWLAFKDPKGEWYYQNCQTLETTWEIPGQSPSSTRWIEVGSAVGIQDQQENDYLARYAGQAGTVVSVVDESNCIVKLPSVMGNYNVQVPRTALAALKLGTSVRVHGLVENRYLNDQRGVIDSEMNEQFRVAVDMHQHVDTKIRTSITKLEPVGSFENMNPFLSQEWLQWRKEQYCEFRDSEGHLHQFGLHMPLNSSSKWANADGTLLEPWPLLVYMHGAGGGSFFTYSKKIIRSEGMNFAAEKFVVLSPLCEWKWHQQPKKWVSELVMQMRACSWIDPERCYLTGCSMGGMGSWEVGSQLADVIAAIAPVAAHHHSQRRLDIAKKLRNMPILAVHSEVDNLCNIKPETELWDEIMRQGNDQLHVGWVPDVDHGTMFDRAYCDALNLYQWLLAHRRVQGTESASSSSVRYPGGHANAASSGSTFTS